MERNININRNAVVRSLMGTGTKIITKQSNKGLRKKKGHRSLVFNLKLYMFHIGSG